MRYLLFGFIPALLFSCGSGENLDGVEGADTLVVIEDEKIIDISLTKINESDLPWDCDYEGEFVDGHTWEDKNGKNYIIRTLSRIVEGEESGENPEDEWTSYASQSIYAYHYIKGKKGLIEIRQVQDHIDLCEFDVNVSHEMNSLTISDIDQDSLGEVAFVYRLTCTSDVSPSTQKLLMLEDGEKYILRGDTEVDGIGGKFEVDESFDNAPEGFLKFCEDLWSQHLTEYDFEM